MKESADFHKVWWEKERVQALWFPQWKEKVEEKTGWTRNNHDGEVLSDHEPFPYSTFGE